MGIEFMDGEAQKLWFQEKRNMRELVAKALFAKEHPGESWHNSPERVQQQYRERASPIRN